MGAGASADTKLLQPAPDWCKLPKEQLARLQRKFYMRLSLGDSTATIEDLQKLPELAGNPMIPGMFQVLDEDGDGALTLDEFTHAVQLFSNIKNTNDLYNLAFMVYDTDQDGSIGAQELYAVLHSILGDSYTDKQLEHVVQCTMLMYDSDGSWSLTMEEFSHLMNHSDLLSKFTFHI